MTKQIFTPNYGIVTVTDVMVDVDGTNLTEGINIHNEDGELLVELAGVHCDDVIDDFDAENYIEKLEEEEYDLFN